MKAFLFLFTVVLLADLFSQNTDHNKLRKELPPVYTTKLVSADSYCTSVGGSTTFERISNVHIVEKPGNILDITVDVFIANPTGCQFADPCPIYDSNPENVNVWIDWNGNEVWESHEQVLDAALTGYANLTFDNKTLIAKTSVQIPPDAKRPTWLRANLGWGYDPEDPCELNWNYGNVVDQQVLGNIKVQEVSATLNINIDDVPQPLWQTSYNENGQVISETSNSPLAGGMKNGFLTLPVKLVSFPESYGDNIRTDCEWEIIGTGINGLAGMTGKDGVIEIRLPQRIGIFELKLKFKFRNSQNNLIGEQIIQMPLWVSYNTPQLSSIKKVWLQKAIEWTNGSRMANNIEDELATKIMNGIYSKSGWRYINGGGSWTDFVEGVRDWGNCRNVAIVWNNLLLVLGVNGGSQAGHSGRKGKGFMSKTGFISFGGLASSNGNARGFVDPRFDRWVFGSHWFGKMGNTYYDPVFNVTGSDLYYHVENDIESVSGNTSSTAEGGPTLYNWESNFTFDEGNWSKYRYRYSSLINNAVMNMRPDEARFTGFYSETPVDLDSDGIYNQLGATVGVEITTPGKYRVTGILQKGDTFITSRSSYTEPAIWTEEFGPQIGNYNINPLFSGENIFNNAQNGPYEMILSIMDSAGIITAVDTFGSASYNFSDFGEFPLQLIQVNETVRDTNNDSYFDEILVSLSSQTSKTMLYTINISLMDSNQTLISSTQTISISTGNSSLDFSLPAQSIAGSSLDGPYTLAVQIISPDGEQIAYKEISTANYSASQFSPPLVRLTGGSADLGVDSNENGLFDFLDISINLESSIDGSFTIIAWLMNQDNETITWAEVKDMVETGSQTQVLKFPGVEINKSQFNGPYKLGYSVIRDESSDLIFSGFDLYTTQNYNASQFEAEIVIISATGNYSENTIDSDSDGLIDTLEIEIEVVPRDSGNVVALGRLVDSQNETILWSSTTEFLQEDSLQKLHLKFDGKYLYGGLVDGPYILKDLQVYHTGDPSQSVDITESYATNSYSYSDFEKTNVITGIVSDSIGNPVLNAFLIVADNDNDYSSLSGKYNLVIVNDGEYNLKIEGPDTLDLEWSISLNGNYVMTGDSIKIMMEDNQLVNVDFKAPVIITETEESEFNTVTDYQLSQNFPNPYNPETTIKYSVSKRSNIIIKIFDVLGNDIKTLINNEHKVGNYEVKFNASFLSSGIYFFRMQADNFVETKKMILMK